MISDNSLFSAKVKDVLTQRGWLTFSSPIALLKGWEGMITACKEGYQYNIYEYDDDLSIREYIELLLSSEVLKEFPEFNEFAEKVKALDGEFSVLLQKDVKRSAHRYWWQQGVPQYGSAELADGFFTNYGIKVQFVDSAKDSS